MSDQDHFNIFVELQNWAKSLENWQRLALLQLVQNRKIDKDTKDDCIYAKRLKGKWYIDRESIDNFMLQDPVKVHMSRLRFVR